MEVTKDLVLESMNTYCTERKYGSEALTDSFREKFSNFFVKKYEGKDVEQGDMEADLHFNLDTAFSSSVDLKTTLESQFNTKKTEYENQIAELNKKLGLQQTPPPPTPPVVQIPKEVQEQLDELKKFKMDESKKEKSKNILKLAKQSIRQDLHGSFDAFVEDFEASLEKEDKEQADKLVSRFQAIFKDSIGDIKPLAPQQTARVENDMLEGVSKIEL